MNGSVYKIYHQLKSRDVYDIYLSKDVNPTLLDEVVLYPMRQLYKEFSQGHIKGRTLLQFNPGPAPYKLLVCCEFFEEINVLEFNEENSKELRKWLKKDPGALDWTRASQYACTLEGKSNGWIEKEEQLRERIKRVIDCDLTADPLVTPGTLPPVDCILSIGGLESIINDQDNFRKNLGKMAALLKVGGHVAFFGAINGKSYKVGEHLVPCFGYNEGFLKAALRDTGFVIESLERRPGVDISDYIIYDSFVYVRARKDPILHYLTYRMNGSVYKIYHQLKSRDFYNTYLSADVNPALLDEVVLYPMRQLYKEFSQGHIKGRTFLQFNPGPAPYKLLVCCEFFEEINVLEFNEENSKELRKWLKKDPGALDWTHASQYACTLEGKSNGWIEKEEQLRERMKRMIDCDLTADPLVTPGTLPPVDCILSIWGLELIINDQDNFRKNLGKMAALLKVGGHVAFFGVINGKSYIVGEQLVPCFGYNESFLKTALRDTGFVIKSLERRPGADISDYIIYDSLVYVRARKIRET